MTDPLPAPAPAMPADRSPALRQRAVLMLLLGVAGWSVSFTLVRAILLIWTKTTAGADSWFASSLMLTLRFGLASVFLAFMPPWIWRRPTRSELIQGLGLGCFASAGLLLQTDGLAHTSASTSAFLTQLYVVLVPLTVAAYTRRLPSALAALACLIVLAGTAVLSVSPTDASALPATTTAVPAPAHWLPGFTLGRGELETLLCAIFFTGQIVWLERPRFRANDSSRVTAVMFLVCTGLFVLVTGLSWPAGAELRQIFADPLSPALVVAAALICTLGPFQLMNRWQPHVSATQAGVIYSAEPVGASFLALFLPGIFSGLSTGLVYPDEHLTWRLLLGGGIILAANALMLLPAAQRPGEKATVVGPVGSES